MKKNKSWIYRRFSLIFLPATLLMMRLSFTKRTVILAIITLFAFSIVTSNLYNRINAVIKTSEKELIGLTLLSPLFKTVQLLQQHRGLSSGVLGGTATLIEQRIERQKQTDDAFIILANTLPLIISDSEQWKTIINEWSLIKEQGMTWSVKENFSEQTRIVDQLLILSQSIADTYALTNAPDLGVFYLLNTTIHQLASTQEYLGQTRAFGTGMLAEKTSSNLQKLQINTLISQANKAIHLLQRNLKKTAFYNPSIEQTILQSAQETFNSSHYIFDLVELDIIQEHYSTTPKDFFQITTDAIDNTYKIMFKVLLPTTELLIKKQRSNAEQVLITSAVIVVLIFLVILYFSIGIYIATVKGIDSIAKATLAFAKGDLHSRLKPAPRSELNTVIKSFNQMADELTRLINAEKEDKARINSIIESAHDALVQINADGNITGWSHQAEDIFGWSKDDVLGKSLQKTIMPDQYKKAYILELKQFLLARKATTMNEVREKTALHRDGHEFPIEISVAPVKTHEGYEFNAFIRDITERKVIEQSLWDSEERYGSIFENALTEIFIFDAESYKFIKANRGACKNIGYSEEELTQLTPLDIKPDVSLKQFNEWAEPLRTGTKEIVHFTAAHQRKNGSLYPVEIYLQLTHFLSKPAFVAIILDITERLKAEEKQQLSEKVFNNTNEGITITDDKGIIFDVNPAFSEITGYSREEVVGKNSRILSSGKQNHEFYADMWQTINERGHWQGEVWNRTKGGELYAELLSISPMLDDTGKVLHYVGIFSDITQSKTQQESLKQMAHYDVLTQLPNRVLLTDRFTQALAHSKRHENILAVCFLDLDDFKPVNDLHGHKAGDELLIEVAKRIKSTIREEDTVSRQGGDEFVLLLGDIESFSQCEHTLKRIIESLSQPYHIAGQSISISASIGITLYPLDNSDFDTLMRHADQAMYQAKLAGKSRYHLFSAEKDQLIIQKNIQLKEVEQALINQELCLFYQPKVNMKTGQVFGAEALIRWLHPDKGLIPPLKFLPVIEETELEIQVGNWVINEALKQLDDWRGQGINIEVSINISSYHMQHPSFVADLRAAIALYPKVHSKKVQLEILESSALGDIQSISRIIKACIHELGVNVALDDFGTGYSSLTHLRSLPAQTIKIDQSFVRDMLEDPNDYAIIDGIIGLAESFNREVIAEGVETSDHGLMLLAAGCYEAQGYGIARPMPADKIPTWLSGYKPNTQWTAFVENKYSAKQIKIQLLLLSLKHWKKSFENNIRSEPGSVAKWPQLKRKKCHCGIFIKQAIQDKLFDESWIKELEAAHNAMHNIADGLFDQYQEGKVGSARNGLDKLQIAVDKMTDILEQYEK